MSQNPKGHAGDTGEKPALQPHDHDILSRVSSLTSLEKLLLRIAAHFNEPIDDHLLDQCLRRLLPPPLDLNRSRGKLNDARKKLHDLALLSDANQCSPVLAGLLVRSAIKDGQFSALAETVRALAPLEDPSLPSYLSAERRHSRIERELRFAMHLRDLDHFNHSLLQYFDAGPSPLGIHPVVTICTSPFDGEWFAELPPQMAIYALNEIYKHSLLHLKSIDGPLQYLRDPRTIAAIPPEGKPSLYYLMTSMLLLRGEVDTARQVITEAEQQIHSFGLVGWTAFASGDYEQASLLFYDDLQKLQRINNKKTAYFTGIEGVLALVAILLRGNYGELPEVRRIIATIDKTQPHNTFLQAYHILLDLVECLENPTSFRLNQPRGNAPSQHMDSITMLCQGVVTCWLEGKLSARCTAGIEAAYQQARASGYAWLAMEFAELLHRSKENPEYRHYAEEIENICGIRSFVRQIRHEETWQRALKALNASVDDQAERTVGSLRMAWFMTIRQNGQIASLTPKEQKLTVTGSWTKGRVVALRKLVSNDLPYLTEQDRLVCSSLKKEPAPWGHTCEFDFDVALPALVGHPLVFIENNPSSPVELIAGQPELRIEKEDTAYFLSMSPQIGKEAYILAQETASRFRVIAINRHHHRIARIIGPHGIHVPLQAKDKIRASIGAIASHVVIHSDLEDIPGQTRMVAAIDTIHVQLQPDKEAFQVAFFVKPFDIGGPYLKPGLGPDTVMAEINGIRLQTKRDLVIETVNARHIEESCPTLHETQEGAWEWYLADPHECLQLLYELREQGDKVVIEWPEGKKMAVSPQLSFEHFSARVRRRANWFEVTGKLQIDNNLVLDMTSLLDLVRKNSGRFIPLGHGQFLTLANEFRKRLEDINAFSESNDTGAMLHPLAATIVNELQENGAHIDTDISWLEHRQRLAEAEHFTPSVPTTLAAELRDYQIDGFMWLARLANWEVGACLADDMGLGKTLQALAIILDRALGGPTLVVAPTSVCINWQEEAQRFAPTMKVHVFGGRNRKKQVRDLGEFDLLIASYGMLQQEAAILTSRQWQTVVLDEAQAIKNMSTKRSKAAMGLKGNFKLITTGTPIENHLGELWNLFYFINPGLLGSVDHFNEQFAIPIERNNDREARRRLKRLIRPFILRRIKSQVLDELPPRTEVVLKVSMSKEETAFYEALRRQAVNSLSHLTGPPGQRHIKILAEIMKLRLACCNPRLIVKDADIGSSKLTLFGEVIEELLANNHKALVFSQFVKHLQLIREHLDAQGIHYQYMDGRTPTKARRASVNAFQAGDGDLFLISLKAGGLGLNLTAADFVIHMDPWWNPAVEDQASDRAHRIGQLHPVTIYRLVTQNTIEEKIVQLHAEKRELADSLLSGSDISGRISADDLLDLLRDI